jgi:hypothetical protein
MKEEFLNVSYELRTPLPRHYGIHEILAEQEADDKAHMLGTLRKV